MDYRIGTCSQCGAEYKVPASFPHDQARCKKCPGVVDLGPPQSAGAAGGAQPELVEIVPQDAETKRRQRGTLARLKAERARAAAGAAPAAAPAADLGAGLDDDLGFDAEIREEPEEAPVAAAVPASRPEEEKPGRRSVSKHGRAGASRGRAGRAGRSAGKREGGARGRRAQSPRKKSPAGALAVVAILVAGAAAAWFFLVRGDGSVGGNEAAAATRDEGPDTTAPAEGAEGAEAGAGVGTGAAAPTIEDEPAATPAEEAPAQVEEAAAAAPDPFVEDPEAKRGAPESIDLAALERCQPARGTTDEEWAEMESLVDTFLDLDAGAAGPRAGRKLEEQGRKAYPAIVNAMLELDLATEAGKQKGMMAQKTLQAICNGNNFDWKDGIEPEEVYFNKKVVSYWAQYWKKAEDDIEVFIKLAKLDEKDADEAARLRELYGD